MSDESRNVQITDECVLLEVPRGKDGKDKLRVTSAKCNGYAFVQIREWYTTPEGETRPGKRGISIKARELDDVIKALEQARTGMRALPAPRSPAALHERRPVAAPPADYDDTERLGF